MDTYEKKYKEALKRAKDMLSYKEVRREDMEYLFPELKESEDERIRKELIENFKWYCGDFLETTKWGKDDNLLVKDIIAWLEKQGQNLANSARTCKDEQKPAWSEEDECYMSECIGAIATKDGWSFEEKRKTKHWLKSLKQRINV